MTTEDSFECLEAKNSEKSKIMGHKGKYENRNSATCSKACGDWNIAETTVTF